MAIVKASAVLPVAACVAWTTMSTEAAAIQWQSKVGDGDIGSIAAGVSSVVYIGCLMCHLGGVCGCGKFRSASDAGAGCWITALMSRTLLKLWRLRRTLQHLGVTGIGRAVMLVILSVVSVVSVNLVAEIWDCNIYGQNLQLFVCWLLVSSCWCLMLRNFRIVDLSSLGWGDVGV